MFNIKKSIQQFYPEKQWRGAVAQLIVALLICFYIYSDTVASITGIWWRSETFAHGALIIPFTLYMIWLRRDRLVNLYPAKWWPGLILLCMAMLSWLLGSVVDVQVLQQLSLLGMVWSLIVIFLGDKVVRRIAYPLAFLFFAIPVGEGLIPYLMDFTAYFTVSALKISGFPVLWEGMSFSIPSGNFQVATACSGVRYLFASLTLGSLFAYINYQSPWRRIVFILFSIILPIIANGLRAYGIVLIAHFSDMKYAVGFDHIIYGWLFFGLIMFVLFYIGSLWRENAQPFISDASIVTVPKVSPSYEISVIAVTVVIMVFGPMWKSHVLNISPPSLEMNIALPQTLSKWNQVAWNGTDWRPDFKGANKVIKQKYVHNNKTIMIYIATYVKESQGAELINQDNVLFDGNDWTKVAGRSLAISNAASGLNVSETIVKHGSIKRILLSWYEINGLSITNIYKGKLYQALLRLQGKFNGGSMIAIAMDVDSDVPVDDRELINFVKNNNVAIQTYLQKSIIE